MVTDPWKVLGISPDASAEEIKKAYRTKAKLYHPDLHPNDPEAAKKMNELNEAYDLVQNPDKFRARQAQEQAQEQARRQRQDPFGSWGGYGGYGGAGGQGGYGGQNGQSGQNGYGNRTRYAESSGYQRYGGWQSDFGGFDFGDLFGFGFRNATGDTLPTAQAGDPDLLKSAINAVRGGQYAQATDILSRMTSAFRNHRWYYVYAAACKGMGDTVRAQDMIERAIRMEPNNALYRQFRNEILTQNQTRSASSWPFSSSGTSVSPLGFIGKLILGFFILRIILRFLLFPFGF